MEPEGDFLYGGHVIVYALLAASDPVSMEHSSWTLIPNPFQVLVHGVKTLYGTMINGTHPSDSLVTGKNTTGEDHSNGIVVHIELTMVHSPNSKPKLAEERSPKHTKVELDPPGNNLVVIWLMTQRQLQNLMIEILHSD